MRIAIIFDRPESGKMSPDHEDVLYQVHNVKNTLTSMGHQCIETGFTLNIEKFCADIRKIAPDLVFNLVESVGGKGNLIHLAPSILDSLGIPYTGSGTDAILRTSNKLFSKEWLNINGVPTPDYVSLDNRTGKPTFTHGEYIIKSIWEHASIGLDNDSVVSGDSLEVLFKEMNKRKRNLGGQCFAEKYIDGREFNLSILAGSDGPEILPPAEIRFESFNDQKRKIVGYKAKWDQDSLEYSNTLRAFNFPDSDTPLLMRMKRRSLKCWELFRINGYCRVDFRVDAKNQPWVLEINANPCISPDAGFMAAAVHAGLKTEDVMERIINDSVKTYVSNKNEKKSYSTAS